MANKTREQWTKQEFANNYEKLEKDLKHVIEKSEKDIQYLNDSVARAEQEMKNHIELTGIEKGKREAAENRIKGLENILARKKDESIRVKVLEGQVDLLKEMFSERNCNHE